jgi:hypothetical protein
MEIYKETSQASNMKHGKLMVGLAPVPLAMADNNVVLNTIKASRGILLRNLSEHNVYVGAENVTVDSGFRVDKDNALHLPIDDPAQVFVVAGDADCEIRWILA